jgi:hypothetical protein
MSELEKLTRHQNALLLAEAIGWLHDYRKCSEEQLQAQSANTTAQGIARTELAHRYSGLSSVPLMFSGVMEMIPDLLNQWSGQSNNANASFLQQYLSRCHNTSHFDKQEPNDSGKQSYPGAQISTAFGYESAIGQNLTNQLWSLPWSTLSTYSTSNRDDLKVAVQSLFSIAEADTRRPVNEITLWDWGMLVGALYKSAIANVILGQQPPNRDLCWRLLSIRTDGLAYLTHVSRLPDLIARQDALQLALNNVQILLEQTYPLATEVYRDENGSLYVVPDLPNLLNLQDNCAQTLLNHIQEQFDTAGEIVPDITLDLTAWWGQDPDRGGNDQIPPAGAILSAPTILQSDADTIRKAWERKTEQICPVCGLRPCVSRQLDYCQICGERRKGRVIDWLKDQSKTIWLDEVADGNGRLALITGAFDLSSWINENFVKTLLVKEPAAGTVTKTPSFARLRRIWRTTQTFWREAQADTNQTLSDSRRRLQISLANEPALTINQTYELNLRGLTRMSLLWDGSQLISVDNLSYTATRLDVKPAKRTTPADAALSVRAWLEAKKQGTFQPLSDDAKNERFDVRIGDINYQDAAYATTIPILTEPRTFMTLVPADKALDVVNAIKVKYEREMGKVRNRLPLHLGVVYFQRRTPLRAALDAGRRMLKYDDRKIQDNTWKVKRDAQTGPLPADRADLAQGTQHFTQTIPVELEQNGRSLTWHVPAVMGDGTTADNWYPYVFIQSDVTNRQRIFKALRPKGDGATEECWLVHAAELKAGDQVYFTPATLDFQWLDSAGQRFEIAYNEQGKRRGHALRPYLLDELAVLEEAWACIGGKTGLTSSQIYTLRDLVETRRESWQPTAEARQKGGMFWQFCRDVVRNANWKSSPKPYEVDRLTDWAVSGLLTEVIQLYMGIMKCKPHREEQEHD